MIFREIELGSADYEKALQLRQTVLRTPLGLTFDEEEIRVEPECVHVGGFDGVRLVAILLLQPLSSETVRMRQVAVHPDLQGGGIGTGLLRFAEELSRAKGFRSITAHARGTALGFYTHNGYSLEGEEFMEHTIPHQIVTKSLL